MSLSSKYNKINDIQDITTFEDLTIEDDAYITDTLTASKVVLIPKTTTEKNNISNPTLGMLVYDSTTKNLNHYDGTTFAAISGGLTANITAATLNVTGSSTLTNVTAATLNVTGTSSFSNINTSNATMNNVTAANVNVSSNITCGALSTTSISSSTNNINFNGAALNNCVMNYSQQLRMMTRIPPGMSFTVNTTFVGIALVKKRFYTSFLSATNYVSQVKTSNMSAQSVFFNTTATAVTDINIAGNGTYTRNSWPTLINTITVQINTSEDSGNTPYSASWFYIDLTKVTGYASTGGIYSIDATSDDFASFCVNGHTLESTATGRFISNIPIFGTEIFGSALFMDNSGSENCVIRITQLTCEPNMSNAMSSNVGLSGTG